MVKALGLLDSLFALIVTYLIFTLPFTIWLLKSYFQGTRAKQVTRYAALDPSIVQSGDRHRQGRISKTGSPLLRTLVVEAAHSLAKWDSGPLGQFYARKAQEIGPRKAIIALARKLLIVAYAPHGRSLPSGKGGDSGA